MNSHEHDARATNQLKRPTRGWRASWRARRSLSLGIAAAAAAVLLAGSSDAGAQVLNFRHYTSAEGLPQTEVVAIKQDRLGYIWFATFGGVSRFNGADFRTYTTQDGLTSNSVADLAEDTRGRLLVGTAGGLCIRDDGRFRCLRQRDGLVDDDVQSVAADPDGGAWVGTSHGLSHLSQGRFRNYTTSDGLPSINVSHVVVDSLGRVWAATTKGLARLEGERFVLDTPDVFGTRAIDFIAPARDGILVAVPGRLYIRRRDQVIPVAKGGLPDGTTAGDGAMDKEGTIWLASRIGVLRIRHGVLDTLSRANGLLSEMINRVTIDREGNIWFGTEGGASKHVPGPFTTYTEREGLANSFVRAIAEDAEGKLWVGGRGGVAVRDGDRFKVIPLRGFPEDRVYALEPRRGGGMFIGARQGLISYVGGRVRLYGKNDGLMGSRVYCLAADGTGGVWIGTDVGLAHLQKDVITMVAHPALAGLSIMSMYRDKRGRLWLGRTQGGIAILDRDSVRLLSAAQGASDQSIWAFAEDTKGRMWVATNGDGALRIDGEAIRRFTMRDGLASNFIWQTFADSKGDVWLFGNFGLDRFSGEQLTHFGRASGLIELEGSAGSSFEDREGSIWFGTGSGVVRFTRGLEVIPTVAPPVFIEEATGDGAPFAIAGKTSEARLERAVVRIRFASPSFRDETRIRFRYRLVGANDAWSAITAERSITYAGLVPGSYRFEVVAMDGSLQSAAPASIDFTMLPAFWQTWWFRSLAAALLLGGTAAIPLVRARTLERERQRLEGLVSQHTRDLADKNVRLERSNRDLQHFAYIASHDLQEPLRKIQAFSDRVTRQYAPSLDERGRDYLARMASASARMQQLIDDLLSLSRVSTKKTPMASIELATLAQEVLGDLEIRIQSTGGRVEIGPLPRIDADPVQMRQVLQNLIGNALKFHRPDEAPLVRVTSVQRDSQTVEICVEDNGIGFDAKDAERVFLPFQRLHARTQYEGTGIGLTICQRIVERHGGSIRAESAPGEGSRFVLTLPTRASDASMEERNAA